MQKSVSLICEGAQMRIEFARIDERDAKMKRVTTKIGKQIGNSVGTEEAEATRLGPS